MWFRNELSSLAEVSLYFTKGSHIDITTLMMMLGNFKMVISFAKVWFASEYRRGRKYPLWDFSIHPRAQNLYSLLEETASFR